MVLSRLIAPFVGLALLAACGAPGQSGTGNPARCVLDGLQAIGGPISLSNQAGTPMSDKDFNGRPTLIYFGFASCPDVCPLALQQARAALEARPAGAEPVQVALVTLDPERDTPETLAAYVRSDVFPEGTVGLTGSRAAVESAAKAFRVLHQRRDDPESALGYTIDHSSFFYLMDAAWRTKALFPSDIPTEEMASCIDLGLKR